MLLRHLKTLNPECTRTDFRGAKDQFKTTGERAFTFIELLVVIGIISVLIGLMFPALHRANDQAKSTICMSRLRQIGFAFQNYAVAYDGRIMFESDQETNGIQSGEAYWFGATSPTGITASGGLLEPFLGKVRGKDLFDCPAAQEQNMAPCPGAQFRGTSGSIAYGAN